MFAEIQSAGTTQNIWYDTLPILQCCPYYFLYLLEGTVRYAGLLLAPAEGCGIRPRFFYPSGQKRAFYAVFDFFFCHF